MTRTIQHGGNLHEAARRYEIPYDAWLDLSTGINPHGYPVPPVPADAWRRLPDSGDGFTEHAARYYGAPDASHVLSVAGSQAAIRALPHLLPQGTVGIAPLTYGEYAPAFARAEHRITTLDVTRLTLPDDITHAVVVNPNNPTAEHLRAATLLQWHETLSERGGMLIIDEAFADAMPSESLAAQTHRQGLVVLRSPGKFFGLAGARAGFVLACPLLLESLDQTLGAWTVSGPARHAVSAAFADTTWQHDMRAKLAEESARLVALLSAHGFIVHSTPLFAWIADTRAVQLHDALAKQGIWTRFFADPASVRFGLPATENEWARLETCLHHAMTAL
ncbi:threonine-phosphate decarboxylase CobD [Paraburkholderia sp. SIMBA_049]